MQRAHAAPLLLFNLLVFWGSTENKDFKDFRYNTLFSLNHSIHTTHTVNPGFTVDFCSLASCAFVKACVQSVATLCMSNCTFFFLEQISNSYMIVMYMRTCGPGAGFHRAVALSGNTKQTMTEEKSCLVKNWTNLTGRVPNGQHSRCAYYLSSP